MEINMRVRCWSLVRAVPPVVAIVMATSFPVVWAASGAAEPERLPRYRLEYVRQDGAAGCPDADALEAGISARLGYEAFGGRAAAVVRAAVQRTAHGLEARIEMLDERGTLTAERRLTSLQRDCAELAGAMELAISIAIDPFQGARPAASPSSSPQPPVEVAPPVAPVPPDPPPPPASPTSPIVPLSATFASTTPPPPVPGPPLALEVQVGVMGGIGTAPTHTFGASVAAEVGRGELSLALEGRADLPATVPADTGEIRASILVASVVPCLHVRALGLCGLATAGALRAAGEGLVDQRQVTIPYLALGARARSDLLLAGPIMLIGHADLSASLVETELRVDGRTRWTSPPLAFTAGIRLGLKIP